MTIDLKSMSRKELEKLQVEVERELQNAEARDRREARKAAAKAAAEFGFSLEDISDEGTAPRKTRRSGPKSKAKFANPENPSETWTGKGRQPNWYRAEIEKGTAPESMAI